MEKYYTPEIEEFRVGFEYEKKPLSQKEWFKTKIECLLDFKSLVVYEHPSIKTSEILRVKYLDRSDIESLGFEHDNNSEPIPPRKDYLELPKAYLRDDQLFTGQLWILYHYEKDNTVWIDYVKDCGGEGYMFKGTIKNKSELKVLLKQLGI